jgi:hypothetical protein
MVVAIAAGMSNPKLSRPVSLNNPRTNEVVTYTPSEYTADVILYEPGKLPVVVDAIASIEARLRGGWEVFSSGPELPRLIRNAKARVARASRRDVLDSLGMKAVRGSVSGRTYYE